MQKAERRSVTLNSFGPGAQALFHGVLGLFALLCILPFAFVIIISFTSEESIRQIGYSFLPLGWSVQAYEYVFALGGALWRSYFNSFLITVIGTALRGLEAQNSPSRSLVTTADASAARSASCSGNVHWTSAAAPVFSSSSTRTSSSHGMNAVTRTSSDCHAAAPKP